MKRTLSIPLFTFFFITTFADAQPTGIDALPPRSFLRIGTAKLRHGDRILCLAYSPDGDVLAAGGGNDPLRIWNPKTGELVQTINEPWVHAMTYSPSGHTLVFGGFQKTVRLWNFKLGKETGRLDGHKAAIKAVAVSPDTTTIASASQDGMIILWNMENKRKVVELTGHADEITAIAFAPTDSNLLVSASNDRTIRFWSVETNQTVKTIDAGCGVLAIAFSADGKTLYSAGDDHLIRRWEVASGKQTGAFKGHHGIVVSLFVQGDKVISGALDKTIRIWDANTMEERKSLSRSQGDCDALAVTQNGEFVATAGLNNTIRVFAAATGNEVVLAPGVHAPFTGLAFSSNRKRLVGMTSDAHVHVWDDAGKLLKQWDTKLIGDVAFALSPDGKTIATATDTMRLWNADNGAELAKIVVRPFSPVAALAFSPDSKLVAVGHAGGDIDLHDIKGKRMLGSFKYPAPLHALAWSPDGMKLAAAGGPKIFIWDPQNDALVKSFDVKEGPAPVFPTVRSLAFGPDSRTLAAGGWDSMIRIYNLNAKNPTDMKDQRLCEGHLSAIFALAFSPDGRTLLSGSFDRTARLWEAFSGKQIAQFKGHGGEVHGVAFNSDGRGVFTAGSDANIFQWDVPGLAGNGKLPALTLGFQELDTAWNMLATEETPKGHEMLWKCVASSKQAVPQLTKNLYYLDPDRVKKLFKELDSSHFPTRTAAMNELTKYGRWMEGRYDQAIRDATSLEYRRRIEILKDKLAAANSPSIAQERLRVRRIMLICEQVANDEAVDALRKLADKGPEEEIRDEAKASLERLKK